MSTLFISHSSQDNDKAVELQKALEEQGHRSVFLDLDPAAGIQAGVSWERTLYTKLRSCRAVVALVSDNYLASQWCFAEIALARMEGKDLFALQIDPRGEDTQLPSILTEKQYIDLRTDPEQGYQRLWNAFEVKGIVPEERRTWKPGEPPYPGLRAFDEQDAPIFFGRDTEVREGIELLNQVRRQEHPRLVMVLGSSGSGKSSLARAGLVPQLRRDKERWLVVGPFRPGQRPARECALALSKAFEDEAGEARPWQDILRRLGLADEGAPAGGPAAAGGAADEGPSARERLRQALLEVEGELAADDEGVARSVGLLKKYLAAAGEAPLPAPRTPAASPGETPLAGLANELRLARGTAEAKVVLLIDQFEELLGHEDKGDDHPANRFLALLKEGIESDDHPPLALGTMRSDFLGLLQQSGPLRGVGFKSLSVGPMSEEGMRHVIEKPALVGAIELEPDLTHRLLRETGTADALPLLAFTLRAMWDRYHEQRLLDIQGYEALGGLHGAIARVADETLEAALADGHEDARKDLRITFLSLARPAAEGGGWARQPAIWDEMPERVQPMIQRFIEQRLLVQRADGTVEVAHEALFRSWETLRGWLNANAEGLHLRREISGAAKDWEAAAGDDDKREFLWRGGRLGRALELRERGVLRLSELDTAFIDASDSEEKRLAAEEEARRQAELDKERELAEEQRRSAEQQRALAEAEARSARRSKLIAWGVAAAAVGAVSLAIYANNQKIAAQDQTLIATASEYTDRDPTRAALLLLELHRPHAAHRAVQLMKDAMAHPLALAELPRHPEPVQTAYFGGHSPGKRAERIVTASRDGRARVWQADGSGEPIVLPPEPSEEAEVREPLSPLTSAVFSHNGEWVVTTADDGNVRMWRADGSRRHPLLLEGHSSIVNNAAVSPADGRIVTASDDGDARLWNPDGSPVRTAAGKPLRLHHEEPDEEVNHAEFSSSGDRIVTASSLGIVRVWVQDPEGVFHLRLRYQAHELWMLTAAFDETGDRIVTASTDKTARVWKVTPVGSGPSLAAEELAVLQHDDVAFGAFFGPGGDRVLTASKDGGARLWALPPPDQPLSEPLTEPLLLLRHDGELNRAAFNSAGDRIVTASKDATVRIWRTGWNGEPLRLAPHTGITTASWSPDGRRAFTASPNGWIQIWDVDPDAAPLAASPGSQDEPLKSLWIYRKDSLRDFHISPSGERIVTAFESGVGFWQAADGQPVLKAEDEQLTLPNTSPASSARYSHDGERVVTASGMAAQLWHKDGSGPLAVLTHPDEVANAFFGGGGEVVTVAGATVRLWDGDALAESSKGRDSPSSPLGVPPAAVFPHPAAEEVLSAAISDDGETLLTVSASPAGAEEADQQRFARIWDSSRTGTVPLDRARELKHDRLVGAALSPSGKWVATTSEDGTARLWNRDGTAAGDPLKGHEKPVIAAAFAPDEKRLVTGSEDSTARIWRLGSGAEPLVLRLPSWAIVSYAEFAPQDGDRVLTLFKNTEAQIWTVSYDLLGARIRGASSVCLDPLLRRQLLGETAAAAEDRYRRCQACQGTFELERGGGTTLKEAFRSYRRRLRRSLLPDWSRSGC